MCHHIEGRDWTALREEIEEAEPDGVEAEAPVAERPDAPAADHERPPIQPSD